MSRNKLVKLYYTENIGPDRWWHRVRDGTMSRSQFVAAVEQLRVGFKASLEAAAALGVV
ncbi:MAG: hypothetical protein QNJ65_09095 [Xenococcaceae cyanobacterium MO_234.B1]|nr:hypothetical protein [Xenococcaceae cyanobacterium MO_234.B1]